MQSQDDQVVKEKTTELKRIYSELVVSAAQRNEVLKDGKEWALRLGGRGG